MQMDCLKGLVISHKLPRSVKTSANHISQQMYVTLIHFKIAHLHLDEILSIIQATDPTLMHFSLFQESQPRLLANKYSKLLTMADTVRSNTEIGECLIVH